MHSYCSRHTVGCQRGRTRSAFHFNSNATRWSNIVQIWRYSLLSKYNEFRFNHLKWVISCISTASNEIQARSLENACLFNPRAHKTSSFHIFWVEKLERNRIWKCGTKNKKSMNIFYARIYMRKSENIQREIGFSCRKLMSVTFTSYTRPSISRSFHFIFVWN